MKNLSDKLLNIAVSFTDAAAAKKAEQLASELHLPLVDRENKAYAYLLVITDTHLELCETKDKNSKPLFVDFLSNRLKSRFGGAHRGRELIAKAVGIKKNYRPTVLDATAGLGVDSFVLATLGCEVISLERSPIVFALLRDGLLRLFKEKSVASLKFTLYNLQAIDYINKIFYMKVTAPDVIYLDPMYPVRTKSALGKKNLRILREIVGDDLDIEEVFAKAMLAASKRVVVKRPKLAPPISNKKPDLSFSSGSSTRYDIYFIWKSKQKLTTIEGNLCAQ